MTVLHVRTTCVWVCVAILAIVGSGCVEIVAIIWDAMITMSAAEKSSYRQNVFSLLVFSVNQSTVVNSLPIIMCTFIAS